MAMQPLHPFPARMDPEAGLEGLVTNKESETLIVLDPMMGSGTVPVLAARRGHTGLGFDIDPLAVMIATALAEPLPVDEFTSAARAVAAAGLDGDGDASIRFDDETNAFVDFWFDPPARDALARMALAIQNQDAALVPALWCAFSRLIITKDAGASRARDVSHSRPHRVRDVASFPPAARFKSSAIAVLARHAVAHEGWRVGGAASVAYGDTRQLPLDDRSVDVIATSPPYLHAIDYLRGHRLTLVWMGWSIERLRELRSNAIGTERGLTDAHPRADEIAAAAAERKLKAAALGLVRRYVVDMDAAIGEFRRVLKPAGRLRLVVSGATVAGTRVSIAKIAERLADSHGLIRTERIQRALRADRRYLPPPGKATGGLEKRMRFEQILTFSPA